MKNILNILIALGIVGMGNAVLARGVFYSCDTMDAIKASKAQCSLCENRFWYEGLCYLKESNEGEEERCDNDLCINCNWWEEAKCPEGGQESGCVCVAPGQPTDCNSEHCITCDIDETPNCGMWEGGEGELLPGICQCLPEGKTGTCTSKNCITCEIGETPLCRMGRCQCIPQGKNGNCSYHHCIVCEANEKAICSSYGDCFCVPQGKTGACDYDLSCVICSPSEGEAMCPIEDNCFCGIEGKYACNETDCVFDCKTGETPYCNEGRGECICVPQGYTPFCNSYGCIACPNGKNGKCFQNYNCECLDKNIDKACGSFSSSPCITCTGGSTAVCPRWPNRDSSCICVPPGGNYTCSDYQCSLL